MSVKVEKEGHIAVAVLNGDIDGKSAPLIQETLANELDGMKGVVLDFTDVTYLSSAGLRLLLFLSQTLESTNASLVLVGVNCQIREVMEQTGFLKHFQLEDDCESARKALDA